MIPHRDPPVVVGREPAAGANVAPSTGPTVMLDDSRTAGTALTATACPSLHGTAVDVANRLVASWLDVVGCQRVTTVVERSRPWGESEARELYHVADCIPTTSTALAMTPESSTDEPSSRLERAVAGSRTLSFVQALDDRLASVGRDFPAARLADRTRRVVTASVLYRWLTAEPDPDVIVIDLRETYTVGPLVAALDRVVGRLADATPDARTVALARGLSGEFRAAPVRLVGVALAVACALALLAGSALGALASLHAVVLAGLALAGLAGTRITASWADLCESRIGRFAVAALDPPSPDGSPTAVSDSDDEGQS